MPRSGHAWFALVIGLVFTLLGGVPLVLGLWSYTWTPANAVIVYSQPYHFARWYEVDVRYKYTYQGREHSGDTYRYRFVMDRLDSSDVDRVQARYPVGEKVRVSVNPMRPTQSVLEAGVEWNDFVWPPIGVFFIFLAFRIDRKRQPAEQQGRQRRFGTAQILLIIGLGIFLYGANTLVTAWRSVTWPTTDGKISYSALHRGRTVTQLWYEYHVQGVRYVAENYRVGGNATPFEDVATAAAQRYPAGRVVKVFYNPNDPSEAVLEPGAWYGNFVFPVMGLLILFGAWVTKKLAAALRR